jgi:hypothetical protein
MVLDFGRSRSRLAWPAQSWIRLLLSLLLARASPGPTGSLREMHLPLAVETRQARRCVNASYVLVALGCTGTRTAALRPGSEKRRAGLLCMATWGKANKEDSESESALQRTVTLTQWQPERT